MARRACGREWVWMLWKVNILLSESESRNKESLVQKRVKKEGKRDETRGQTRLTNLNMVRNATLSE